MENNYKGIDLYLVLKLGIVLELALIIHYELSEPQIGLILLIRQSRIGLLDLELDLRCVCRRRS